MRTLYIATYSKKLEQYFQLDFQSIFQVAFSNFKRTILLLRDDIDQ